MEVNRFSLATIMQNLLTRYIHLTPLRAKLVKDPKVWAWSSHRQYLGHHKEELADCALTLSMFHSHPARARGLYTAFVQDGLATGHQRDYYPSQTFPYLGDEAFASRCRELLEEKEPIEKDLEEKAVESRIHEKGYRNRPLTEGQKENNRQKSRVRARIEHVFGHLTNSMGGIFLTCTGMRRTTAAIEAEQAEGREVKSAA